MRKIALCVILSLFTIPTVVFWVWLSPDNSNFLPIADPWLTDQIEGASDDIAALNQDAREKSWPWVCGEYALDDKEYIILNTNVPFVWRCIKKEFNEGGQDTNVSNVFPKLMANMIRIVMVVLVVWWFLWILVWWFMIAANGAFGTKQTGVKLILGIIAGLILLWASGILLNLINPNFFGAVS